MKKKYIIFISVFLSLLNCNSNVSSNNKNVKVINELCNDAKFIQLNNSTIALTYTNSYSNADKYLCDNYKIKILEFDDDGNLVLKKEIVRVEKTKNEIHTIDFVKLDNNIYAIYTTSTIFGHDDEKTIILKLDNKFNIITEKYLSMSNSYWSASVNDKNKFIIYLQDEKMIKFDNNCEPVVLKDIHKIGYQHVSVSVASDNKYFITGIKDNKSYIYLLNEDFDIIWNLKYEDGKINKIIPIGNGNNFVVAEKGRMYTAHLVMIKYC